MTRSADGFRCRTGEAICIAVDCGRTWDRGETKRRDNLCPRCHGKEQAARSASHRERNLGTNPYSDETPRPCRKCARDLPPRCFDRHAGKPGGLESTCRACLFRVRCRHDHPHLTRNDVWNWAIFASVRRTLRSGRRRAEAEMKPAYVLAIDAMNELMGEVLDGRLPSTADLIETALAASSFRGNEVSGQLREAPDTMKPWAAESRS